MKRATLFVVVMGASLVGAGCASVGNEKMRDQTQASMSKQIIEGKTTKSEVEAALGSANAVTFTDAGNEIWRYQYAHATPKARNFIPIVGLFSRGADVTTKELVILFDKNSVVSKYTMRDSKSVINRGIVQ